MPKDMSEDIPKVFPELGLPQVVPTIQEFLEEYTKRPENLPIHSLVRNLKTFPKERNTDPLFQFHRIPVPIVQQVKRDPTTGKLIGLEEVETDSEGKTAKNSLSLTRAPGGKDEGLKGSSTNFPFWPGGFEDVQEALGSNSNNNNKATSGVEVNHTESQIFEKLFSKDLMYIPPGFEKGLSLEGDDKKLTQQDSKTLNDQDESFLQEEKNSLDFWYTPGTQTQNLSNKLAKVESKAVQFLNDLPEEIFAVDKAEEKKSKTHSVLKISQSSSSTALFLPWAETIDVTKPMLDFKEKVPEMAFKYPFELDTFQKQAIARLEEHENVFVAAHTSAGKTVVAEYAIALSVRHMTRTIYTSPIKALSNQKFRDFKNHFESVGLVTGDVQINPSASVLIMTTEILRSMLYNGSDVIRDLEWVVFDEIHYLNNEERGHVWEEVLIMLPPHVSIIMLSATVPNALQFANWVGEIKKKKIYVISTPKRPVPLEHYLYTGSGGKSRDEVFLLLDADGKFLKKGIDDAVEAKQSRQSKHQQSFGPKDGKRGGFSEASEKTTYIGLVNHLKENDKLPVVIFTFSRKRCDDYARIMSSVDLLTGAQKAEVHGFFMRSISRLKGTDRELPQVQTVHEMLKNGIGVHHSGILPILKEVVEMLFQRGLVKLLFATETFAMGVNMPARTVVFDSTRKHDGTSFRSLNPAEYIQMAGRAGRRGLDTTGTVILLCKQNVPNILDLKHMMLGKAAKLESQFRLTYSMILNLLRVESLTVEDVMKRSFLEAGARTKIDSLKEKITEIKEVVSSMEWENNYENDLIDFYKQVKECIGVRETLIPFLKSHTKMNLFLPGRVVIVEKLPEFSARYGVILDTQPPKPNPIAKFRVLILTSEHDQEPLENSGWTLCETPNAKLIEIEGTKENLEQQFKQFIHFAHNNPISFLPKENRSGFHSHTVIEVEHGQILEIVDRNIRVDSEIIINDVRRRELPRFADDPPLPNVRKVLEDLILMNINHWDVYLVPSNQRVVSSKDMNLLVELQKFEQMKVDIKRKNVQDEWPEFKAKFFAVFYFMKLKDTLENLEYLLSPRSLRLHEEYQSRIQVLRQLGYIDNDNLVQMKGRVACEMGNQNELMVTEMVLNNLFSTSPPEEVASILSCLVFEAKNVEEPSLVDTPGLKHLVAEVKRVAATIGEKQRECGLKEPVLQFVEQFRFGLVEVVYEWAKGKPFSEIMKLTECQEGLIVRTIQRLDEMIRDVKDAARIIGDPSLRKKMEEASECIKRDIVFAASLYTQDQ